jgi:hypothetical protein
VLLDGGTIAQVIGERDAGVVDEDVERCDSFHGLLNLRCVGHVQDQGSDARIRVTQRLARRGIHPLRASPQGLLDERAAQPAVGPGHKDRLAFDCRCLTAHVWLLLVLVRDRATE